MTTAADLEVDEATRQFPATLDPSRNTIVSAFGRKGPGKSTFNRRLYETWPLDKLCVDVNGEAEPGEDATSLRGELPAKYPPRAERNVASNLHYVAKPSSPTFRDDLDRSVALVLYPQDHPVLGWFGEVGEFTTGNKTGPHLRTLLMQSRHYKASALFDGPRPIDVDKLVIAQADLVAIFDLPDPDDRDRVAKVIGWPPKPFATECDVTRQRGLFWFLLYQADGHRLWRCPPLPH